MMRRRALLFVPGAACLATRAEATPADVADAIGAVVGDGPLKDGLIHIDMPVMVENGNAVSITLTVQDPPAPVAEIHVFAEGNPLPRVAVFRFGPRSGAPRVATRMRLATSQTVVAIAKLRDGTCWRDRIDLLVTLAACVE
jgi:sulfur-oxidizing protein SoxY